MTCDNFSFYGLTINCTNDIIEMSKDSPFWEEYPVHTVAIGSTVIITMVGSLIYRYKGFFLGITPPTNRI